MPSNIEKHLMTHPAVEDAAVVGLRCEVYNELPVAFIVLKPGQHVSADELVKFINGNYNFLPFPNCLQ